MMADGQGDEAEAGVGNAGYPGVRDQSDLGAGFKINDQFGRLGHLIVLVIADGASVDSVVREQLLRLARVLAGDQVNLLEHAQGAQGDVLEIADWRGDKVEGRTGAEGPAVIDDFGLCSGQHKQSLTRKTVGGGEHGMRATGEAVAELIQTTRARMICRIGSKRKQGRQVTCRSSDS